MVLNVSVLLPHTCLYFSTRICADTIHTAVLYVWNLIRGYYYTAYIILQSVFSLNIILLKFFLVFLFHSFSSSVCYWLYKYHNIFTSSLILGHLGYFHFSSLTNNAVMNRLGLASLSLHGNFSRISWKWSAGSLRLASSALLLIEDGTMLPSDHQQSSFLCVFCPPSGQPGGRSSSHYQSSLRHAPSSRLHELHEFSCFKRTAILWGWH